MNALSILTAVTKDVRTPLVHLSVLVVMGISLLVMEGHALVSHPYFCTSKLLSVLRG